MANLFRQIKMIFLKHTLNVTFAFRYERLLRKVLILIIQFAEQWISSNLHLIISSLQQWKLVQITEKECYETLASFQLIDVFIKTIPYFRLVLKGIFNIIVVFLTLSKLVKYIHELGLQLYFFACIIFFLQSIPNFFKLA